jgi:hypothetical protein
VSTERRWSSGERRALGVCNRVDLRGGEFVSLSGRKRPPPAGVEEELGYGGAVGRSSFIPIKCNPNRWIEDYWMVSIKWTVRNDWVM